MQLSNLAAIRLPQEKMKLFLKAAKACVQIASFSIVTMLHYWGDVRLTEGGIIKINASESELLTEPSALAPDAGAYFKNISPKPTVYYRII